jgi:hypothetical protein
MPFSYQANTFIDGTARHIFTPNKFLCLRLTRSVIRDEAFAGRPVTPDVRKTCEAAKCHSETTKNAAHLRAAQLRVA